MKIISPLLLCLCNIFIRIDASPTSRIVGGDDAVLGQLPYQAALSIAGTPTCGAVILSERYALTAMQCVCSLNSDKPWPPQMFTITAGTTDLYTGGVRITLERITVNPNYSEFRTGIAILKLLKPLDFSQNIQPITLTRVRPVIGAVIEISGWGRIKEGESNMYRTLQLNEGSVEKCAAQMAKSEDSIICVGHPRKNGICRGDFGGPAVHAGKLVGIAAYVVGECGSLLPDVFTSVASNYEWITEHLRN